jgi:hypothetical protein
MVDLQLVYAPSSSTSQLNFTRFVQNGPQRKYLHICEWEKDKLGQTLINIYACEGVLCAGFHYMPVNVINSTRAELEVLFVFFFLITRTVLEVSTPKG